MSEQAVPDTVSAGARATQAAGAIDFAQLVAQATDGILLLDAAGRVRYANPAAARLLGQAPEQLIGTPCALSAVADGVSRLELAQADGSRLPLQVRAVPLTEAPGRALYLRDDRERHRAEAALRRGSALYSSILEDLPELICRWRPDGSITYVNEHYCRYFGRPRETLIGKNYSPLVAAPDRERVAREAITVLQALAAPGVDRTATFETEHRVYRHDGAIRWQRWIDRGLFDEAGNLVEIQSVGQDVTEARAARLALETSNARLEAAQRIAKLAFWEWRPATGTLWWSPSTRQILGRLPASDGLGFSGYFALVHPEDLPRLRAAEQFSRHTGQLDHEHRILRPDGEVRWVRLVARPAPSPSADATAAAGGKDSAAHDAEGAPRSAARIPPRRHLLGVVQDITERKQREERLRLAAAVFDHTSEGIIITDRAPRIIATNRAFTQLTGYRESEVLGHNPSLLASGRHDADFFQAMWRALQQQGHWRGEILNRHRNGEVQPHWLNINALRTEQGEVSHYVGVFSDIRDMKRSEAQIERLAHRDPLTDLPNRLLFRTRLEQALTRAAAIGGQLAVLLVDLDGFRHINDSLGHGLGDAALCAVARRLQGLVGATETVARFSGDEFALLLEATADINHQASQLAERILANLARPLEWAETNVLISASIGIALYPDDAGDVAALLQNSDAALYQARESGGGTYRHYARALSDYARDRVMLSADLHRAIARDELVLHYQPQVDGRAGQVRGLEALVRWQHPQRGMLPPDLFIRVAEESGLIVPLGEWVLRQACTQFQAWLQAGVPCGRLAVNCSGGQVQRSDLTATVMGILGATGLAPERLELELTESFVMDLRDQAPRLLADLKRHGIAVAMDDFGTGYSSLAYLKGLPFNTIKIDRSFIQELPDDLASTAIVEAIVALGRNLGFAVVAEGVEHAAQREFLLAAGCDLAQGYLYSPPVPAAMVPDLIAGLNAAGR